VITKVLKLALLVIGTYSSVFSNQYEDSLNEKLTSSSLVVTGKVKDWKEEFKGGSPSIFHQMNYHAECEYSTILLGDSLENGKTIGISGTYSISEPMNRIIDDKEYILILKPASSISLSPFECIGDKGCSYSISGILKNGIWNRWRIKKAIKKFRNESAKNKE
jgi:hypothetical protein